MRLPIYQIDAFTAKLFGGNPAAICPLDRWLPDTLLQSIAAENNLAETAYIVPVGPGRWHLRWFTPAVEVPLCGHATLAAAYFLAHRMEPERQVFTFDTLSGPLTVTRSGDLFTLDFPVRPPVAGPLREDFARALGATPLEHYTGAFEMAVFGSEAAVRALAPDMRALAAIEHFALIATAPGDEVDFVSRFFAPRAGIDEDPVTGSAHCMLTPYWSARLGKAKLTARQISPRVGDLWCEAAGDRVLIAGHGAFYLEGFIEVPDQA
ncbi:MAG: PhzF family phenazine biosynthesis protein [Bryobacteraceae bacterium]|nr:PhzF family phenazine biosynthesis protein [Bryobacteraceae bacterium]